MQSVIAVMYNHLNPNDVERQVQLERVNMPACFWVLMGVIVISTTFTCFVLISVYFMSYTIMRELSLSTDFVQDSANSTTGAITTYYAATSAYLTTTLSTYITTTTTGSSESTTGAYATTGNGTEYQTSTT